MPSEMGKKGNDRLQELYPNHEPQRLGGQRGAVTKLKNDPDYFKKIRAKGVAKQKQAKKDNASPAVAVSRLILGE